MHRDRDDVLTPDDDRLVDLLRRTGPDDVPAVDAPESVWAAIDAALERERGDADAAPGRAGLRVVDGGAARPPRRVWMTLGAVAAAVALVVAGGVLVLRNGTPARSEVVASARLAQVADGAAGSGRGAAQLVRRADGTHLLVEVDEMRATDRADFFELWLLDRSNGDPQSLGKMDRSGARTLDVLVPDRVDTARFPVVDISSEIDDGDATHSGRSVLRGTLT